MSLLHAEDAAQELSLRQSRYAPQKVQVHTNAYKHFEIHTHVCQYIYIHTTRFQKQPYNYAALFRTTLQASTSATGLPLLI